MKRLYIPIVTMLFTLLVGLAIPSMADDTDLYINMTGTAEKSETVRPNILFVLDASGSMNDPIMDAETRTDGTGKEAKPNRNRQEVLQEALLTTLERIQDVNVGLERFTQAHRVDPAEETNAAILYPIAFIDAPIAEVEGEGGPLIIPVSAPVVESTDDAEENVLTKKISLYDTDLELTEIPKSEEVGITMESPITLDGSGSKDDAKEYLGDGYGHAYSSKADYAIGKVWIDGAVFPLGGYTSNLADAPADTNKLNLWNGETLIGLRFRGENGDGVGIPQGAVITKAVVAFTAHNPGDYVQGDLSLAIRAGYDSEKIAPFSQNINNSVSNYQTTRAVKDADGKPITAYWNDIPAFDTEGKVYTFTDENLTKLVQTVVDQGCEIDGQKKTCDTTKGWQYGSNMSLFFERKRVDDSGNLLGLGHSKLTTGMRAIKTAETGTSSDSPKLRISWYSPPTPIQEISKGAKGNDVQKKEFEIPNSASQYTYIRLGNDPFGKRGPTKVGVRFEGVSIPPGAKIKEAKIVFTHQSATFQKDGDAGRADTDLTIYAEKISNSIKLSGTIDGTTSGAPVPTVIERISTSKTDKSVAWENIAEPPSAFKYSAAPSTSDIDINIENFETPELKEILQEVVGQAEWASNNAVTFLFESKNGSTGSRRIVAQNDKTSGTDLTTSFTTVNPTDATLPKLEVKYSVADPNDTDNVVADPKAKKQKIGLRFQTLTVPFGAEIVSAKLTVKSKKLAKGRANLQIQAEEVDYDMENGVDAKPFILEEDGNISARKLSAPVSWDIIDDWEEGLEYSSDDLTSLIQPIVNRSGWCGGSTSIVLVISAKDENEKPFRDISSFDDAPDKAPVLNVEYNSDSVQGGCLNQRKTWRISEKDDDAEEFKIGMEEPGIVDTKSQTLELANTKQKDGTIERVIGLRFPDIPVSPGSKIRDARLEFWSSSDQSKAVTLKIYGQKGNAATFAAEKNNLTKRPKTSTKLSWTPEAWKAVVMYKTKDISPIIQEIIDGSWEANDDLALFIEHESGDGYRTAVGLGNDPRSLPKVASLSIQIEGELEGGGLETVRFRLMNVVKKMDLGLWTNIVDGLYEAAQYYRGGKVTFGKDRYKGGKYDAQGRIVRASHVVSNPFTYKNGTLVKDDRCTELFPYDPFCATEKIEGSPDYVSPIKEAGDLGGGVGNCPIAGQASNYVILLTDGIATRNRAVDKAQQLIAGTCKATPANYECKKGGCGTCGIELVKYLATHDNGFNRGKEIDGSNVCVHTIGFDLGTGWEPVRDAEKKFVRDENGEIVYKENTELTKANDEARKYLQDLADNSCPESRYFDARTAEELSAAFESIISSAIVNSASFAAPSISVSTVNRLFHRNEVYYAVFRPGSTPRWHGNIKKYHVCTGPMQKAGQCEKVGLVVDSEGNSVVDPETQYIKDSAKSFWGQDVDGNNITKGGAGGKIPAYTQRTIFTYLPSGDETLPEPGSNRKIALENHTLSVVLENKKALLQKAFGDLSGVEGITGVNDVVDWILGKDVLDEKSDGDGRWRFADPLHSSPSAITYMEGGEETVRLIVGTNDGLLHLINAKDSGAGAGREEWAFLPSEMLSIQPQIMSNVSVGGRVYGMDGTPTVWMNAGSDGIVNENGESVRVFAGMRRGGSNYYALDVTDPQAPKLMWVIKGAVMGSSASTEEKEEVETQQPTLGFERLGQSWSNPLATKIIWNGQSRNVLIFAGGFDPNLEKTSFKYEKSTIGNSIYIVDLEEGTSGTLLWWASNTPAAEEGGNAQFLQLKDMEYAIPSTVALADTDGDRHKDRLYVGDLGGQVWRVDLNNLGNQGGYDAGVGAVLARIGAGTEHRRFFYPPAIYLEAENNWVTIISGSRPIPLDTVIQDRFFAFKDRATSSELRALFEGDGLKDCEGKPGASHPPFCTINSSNMPLVNTLEDNVDGQMYDATLHLEEGIKDAQGATTGAEDSESTVTIDEDKLASSLGWYLNLRADYNYETGEIIRATGNFKGEKGLASPIILETDDGVKVFFSTYTPWTDGIPLDKCEGLSRLYALALTSGVGDTKSLKNGITSDISPMFVAGGGLRIIMNDPSITRCGLEKECDILLPDGEDPPADVNDPYYGSILRPRLNRNFWQQIFSEE